MYEEVVVEEFEWDFPFDLPDKVLDKYRNMTMEQIRTLLIIAEENLMMSKAFLGNDHLNTMHISEQVDEIYNVFHYCKYSN